MDQDAEDFLSSYSASYIHGETGGGLKKACSVRQCLFQSLLYSATRYGKDVEGLLKKTKLTQYGALVDDKDGLNNFGEGVQSLVSGGKIHCKKWRGSVSLVHGGPAHPGTKCGNRAGHLCLVDEPRKEDLKRFVRALNHQRSQERVSSQNQVTELKVKDFCGKSELPKVSSSGPLMFRRTGPIGKPDKPQFPPVPQVCRKVAPAYRAQPTTAPKSYDSFFKTAKQEMKDQSGGSNKELWGKEDKKGSSGRSVSKRFVPPVRREESTEGSQEEQVVEEVEDERLKHIDPRMVELIRSEIMDQGAGVTWDHIAGLQFAKAIIQEVVVWPLLRPDIFTGLRRPPKGILLFGPPGTGKTLIGKCVASQSNSTFFSISASSLTSKWIGDGEKMVRALFAVARCHQPAVVFIDEIDSLLSQRSETEHESSRRIKTEFLVQLDGAGTGEEDRILVIGATNRPQELDEAARRRLVKRLYIPLPDLEARGDLVTQLMSRERHELSEEDVARVARLTDGYSGADLKNLCQEACLGPVRAIPPALIHNIAPDQVRPVNMADFEAALARVKSSVAPSDLDTYVAWNNQYGMSR